MNEERKSAQEKNNQRILDRVRGVPAKNVSLIEALTDPSNPNVVEQNDNHPPASEAPASADTETLHGKS